MTRRPVIAAAKRTVFGRNRGSLSNIRPDDLLGETLQQLLAGAPNLDPSRIDDVIMGDCIQCADEANTARTAMLSIGLPFHVPAVTIQRQCSSAMQAVIFGAQQIKCGDGELVLAGGCESMSNAPYVLSTARWGQRLQHGQMTDTVWEALFSGSNLLEKKGYIMGETAENLAAKYAIQRREQDEVAVRSHNNAEAATAAGRFRDEIVPVEVAEGRGKVKVVDQDEHFRPGLKMEDLDKLKPAFRPDGTVTAGNSSGLNDGGAAVVLASRRKAREMGRPPLARLVAHAAAGVEPHLMGYGPVPATRKALAKAGLSLDDIGLVEVNEAFAAQYLAVEKNLGLRREVVNVNGSGIGLGHPIGATGARIIITLVHEMRRRGVALGLATLCVGGGMGVATIVEAE